MEEFPVSPKSIEVEQDYLRMHESVRLRFKPQFGRLANELFSRMKRLS